MSTIFDIRKLRLPKLSRASVIIGSLGVVLALVAAVVGWQLYQKLTNNTVVAYFPEALAIYSGDKVQIMGIRVGAIDKIEPAGDKMKVTFHYNNKYKVPADASAVILNPTLVASRTIQLEPPYRGGPALADNAVIPVERTQAPVEWDELRTQFTKIVSQFGPTPQQPKGPFGEIIESFADGLAGKGKQINTTLDSLSQALTALNDGRGDFFAVLRSAALFVNALHADDQQFVAVNQNLAQFTHDFTNSGQELASAIQQTDGLLSTVRPFLAKNREVLTHDVNNLADVTNTVLQPDPRNGLETTLHAFPMLGSNFYQIYHPAQGTIVGEAALANFANPMEFICSAIQAGSRLGYQESAELCAQYLAPALDAIKFNYLPFGLNPFNSAATLPKDVAYSEERLRPPPGYKDTTVPGIWVPDTPLSHRNTQPGWIVAPGMQGTQVGPITSGLLTAESLGELMGGPDIAPVQSTLRTPPGPPNAYDEHPVAPPIGLQAPQVPVPPPPPGPDVMPGPVAPTLAPVAGPAPAGPPLPAETGSAPAGVGQ
jgi:phospholipid/cholesterol/gamma-HCH transport system substrate-binding protein